jgi:hypothetical protein
MPARTKQNRGGKRRSVRQSVTIPPALAAEVRRVAKDRQMTMSNALVSLAERGIRAERDAKAAVKSAYERFMGEQDFHRKEEAGKELIRAIFGKDSIAEDPVL